MEDKELEEEREGDFLSGVSIKDKFCAWFKK